MAGFTHATYLLRAKEKLRGRIVAVMPSDEEMSAVDNARLPVMPQGSAVILSQDVYDALSVVQDVTVNKNREIPFLLFGRVDGQVVYFDKFTADSRNMQSMEAKFSPFLVDQMQDFIAESPKNGTCIVAHGHSHPRLTNYYTSFSLGDLTAYMEMQDGNPVFKSKQIEFCGVMLANGNYNFIFFDGNDYYKFTKVFYQDDKGEVHPLPCYDSGNTGLINRIFRGGRNS